MAPWNQNAECKTRHLSWSEYIFFVHVKLALSQRVIRFQVLSHNYVFSHFCNYRFQSSPLNHKEKKYKKVRQKCPAFSDSCNGNLACLVSYLELLVRYSFSNHKKNLFLCLKDYDDEMLALSLLSLRHVFFKIHEVRIRSYIGLTQTAETYNSDPRMKMKPLTEFPCFLYTYQNKFLRELYWSFWAA